MLVAIGDEPLGVSVQGELRRFARLDLLAAYLREATATAQDRVTELEVELRHLADTVARDDPKAQARVRTLEARNFVDRHCRAPERLAIATGAHRLAVATEDPELFLDATELLMSAELIAVHTARATSFGWSSRPRPSAGSSRARSGPHGGHRVRAAARGAELGLPGCPSPLAPTCSCSA